MTNARYTKDEAAMLERVAGMLARLVRHERTTDPSLLEDLRDILAAKSQGGAS